MDGYEPHLEQHMQALYKSLRENDRRRYAAIEAEKLGPGGTEYIAQLFACDPKTIRAGRAELEKVLPPPSAQVRQKGGAAKLS